MAKASAGAVNPHARSGVRIVVAGDRGTGKSSLIVTAATETFPANIPPVLPPTRLPEDLYPDRVPIIIIDTSSRYDELNFDPYLLLLFLVLVPMLFHSRFFLNLNYTEISGFFT